MSENEKLDQNEINSLSFLIFENLTDWIEVNLNDHLPMPIDDEEYFEKRIFDLDDAEYEEKKVVFYEKENNKLNGLPTLIEGEIFLNDNIYRNNITITYL